MPKQDILPLKIGRRLLTRHRLFLAVALAVPLLLPGGALRGQQDSKITSQVKLVTVYATVRDKHGKIMPNLNKEDFVLDEDGRAQSISNFVRESDLPLTLGLLVDTSLSQRRVLESERSASYTFLDHMLREDKDKAFLIHFDREVELLQDLTSSRPKLQSGLQLLQTPELDRDDEEGRGRGGAGTLLYDAIYLASNELMKKQQGRKALFVLSDGVDRGSRETLGDAVESAQRADAAVYSIYFTDDEPNEHGGGHGGWGMGHGGPMGWPGGGGPGGGGPGGGGPGGGGHYPREERTDGKKVLDRISTETGGRMLQASKKLTIDQIYAQIEEELRNQYSLGYTPNPPNTGGGYHKIHLKTKQTDLIVQARDGYYSDR
ncbi:MAG TPA: VWA domain-containing protein [Candidatus Acidoferrales bacterium]|nr:VWA domain-containing protein [Candidatus Acidoferrales bacterium]